MVDPDAAGEAGAAAVDGVDLLKATSAPDSAPGAISFPMDFPEVQSADAPEDDAVPGRP